MNNPSPLVPQGSMLEQKNAGRARVKLAVYFVLAVHGIGLMALLMQGCRKEETTTQTQEPTNTLAALPPQFDPTNTADPVAQAMATATNNTPSTPTADAPPAQPPAGASEYTIVPGDTYSTIGKKFHVTVRALTEANPNVQATRLRPGAKLHIPAAVQTASATATPAPGTKDTASSDKLYEVKSGDTLSKIATEHKTTVRAIRSVNKLATDRITVGQKLKIPAASQAAPTTVAAGPTTPVTLPGAQ